MENLINETIQLEHETSLLRDKLKVKENILLNKISKISFELYRNFIDNNWEHLNSVDSYFNIFIEDKLIVRKVLFDKIYNNHLAVFKLLNQNNLNINVSKNIIQEEYTSNSVVIDKKQLDFLSQYYKIAYLN
jgi:hypothetical protein